MVLAHRGAYISMGAATGELQGDALLSANLEYLASLSPSVIRPVLPQLPGGAGLLPDDFQLPPTEAGGEAASIILQVNAVEDVSLPLAQRLRAMAAPPTTATQGTDVDPPDAVGDEAQQISVYEMLQSMESDDPASHWRGRRQRLLRLILTDGFTRVIAFEDCRQGCDALRGGVAWGTKLCLLAPLQIRHGVLILTSQQTVMLGGFLPELQEFWEKHAKEALEEMSGRPKKQVQQAVEGLRRGVTSPTPEGAAETHTDAGSSVAQPPASSLSQQQQQQQQQLEAAGAAFADLQQTTAVNVVNPSPLQPSSIHASQPQPLSAWQAHHPRTFPFKTIAVIREVKSDLKIQEFSALSPDEAKRFSLFVLLATPPDEVNRGSQTGETELLVDIGHGWLQQALRMDPDTFCALCSSRQPGDVARLGALLANVGRELENLDVAVFVLRQREIDGAVEVVEVHRPQSSSALL
ncbi:apurinic/apyrimidinic endonuclease [Trypanosoma rangeli]|uniref:RecQ-mediated genome instability protein 1 n=1 Tax=Trypanosoma rangeli TaxID=5698 RepID=A0A422NGJ8_TRYRA|nr:apurinic/apyrimidinic endonuclease [Trypanosoma rangeli]RNF04578.1 apurinic/apyrimidinic endonuclease [Trypanosoma rangeli]|eukprot:RNF04578.1 apurinic/apyrimidinic endonuclease [Trypanosoma rangeli]